MATVCIKIENDTVLKRFYRMMNHAAGVSSSMVRVKTQIDRGMVVKVVRTECPWAIAVFRCLDTVEA